MRWGEHLEYVSDQSGDFIFIPPMCRSEINASTDETRNVVWCAATTRPSSQSEHLAGRKPEEVRWIDPIQRQGKPADALRPQERMARIPGGPRDVIVTGATAAVLSARSHRMQSHDRLDERRARLASISCLGCPAEAGRLECCGHALTRSGAVSVQHRQP